MDDFNFWWYIIAAVIYFLTRGKKKKKQPSRPGTENSPTPKEQPKSFEDLLREITEGRQEERADEIEQEPVVIEHEPIKSFKEEKKSFQDEGRKRSFADDESRRVYEESIKMAEGADLKFEPAEQFKTPRLFKDNANGEEETSFAQELMDGFDADEAKKAVIYAEILNRKY